MYLKTLTGSGLSPALAVSIPGGLASERIVNAPAEPRNWLAYWGDLQDRRYKGENRKLILHTGRNGVFYVLDRTDGKLLSATPYVRTSWMARTGKPL